MEQANTIEEFLKILKRYEGQTEVFYRGQSTKYKSVNSSISRDSGHLVNEHKIYWETVKLYKQEFETLKFPIERLAKLQHYGIPTRLIDVSIDPLTALYFAVEDVDSDDDGNVLVYVQPSKPMYSKPVQLLALLATLNSHNTSYIQEQYKTTYNENISKVEIINLSQETSFVTFSDELKAKNPRLHSQKGTFVICGNELQNEEIQKQVKPLDSIKPNVIIRIPYEYKLAIKNELDQRHLINKTTIYPEFPSVADYIKEKYKETNISLDGTYSIIEKQDNSYPGVKRLSIKVTLNNLLRINEIHEVAKFLIKSYQKEYDVIFIFIAKNGDDYIMYNWILRSLWLDPANDKIQISPFSQDDGSGYSWEEGESYNVLADYHDKYVFKDDKFLFVSKQKLFKDLYQIHKELLYALNYYPFDSFILLLNNYEDRNRKANLIMGDIGVSRNKDLNEFLHSYTEYASMFDNISLWYKKDHLNIQNKKYQIKKCFEKLQENAEFIQLNSSEWSDELEITSFDIERIDPYHLPEQTEYQFEPTIPLNPNALKVEFKVEIEQKENRSLHISGKTNLYDNAKLLLSIKKTGGKLYGQNKADVKNGNFDFGLFNYKERGYEPGNYTIEIIVSIPSTQPESFRLKAGLEYENLAGPYVKRSEIAPIIKYKENFKVL